MKIKEKKGEGRGRAVTEQCDGFPFYINKRVHIKHHIKYKNPEDDFHLRELPMEVLQVLLDPCDELHTFNVSKIMSATVDQQDIWHSSSSKSLIKKRIGGFFKSCHPNQTTGHGHPDQEAEVC